MKNFITNSKSKILKNRLIELIKESDELKFLVGFFYFSGIRELYDGLKNNPNANIKILVGLNVDKTLFGLIEHDNADNKLSDEEKINVFLQSVKKSLNSDDFDTKEFYEQVKFFVELIKNDKLVIRKTYEPNHAKLYIFKLNETQIGTRQLFITGSSNLTKAGLSIQDEFNVEISDYGTEDTEEYFDTLWNKAVEITENDTVKKNLIKLIEKDTLVKEISPFEAFVFIIKTYLDSFEKKEVGNSLNTILQENNYIPYKYLFDAVKQALSIIEKNNGVIIADVVGLGKTVVACSIAHELRKRGMVICPPGLVGDKNKKSGWKKYAEEFKLYDWEIRSIGDLENIAEFVNNAKDIDIIIIDEAHRFRNQDTKDYEFLRNICRNKIVILLTATPFNNKPGDILSLLKLFVTPKKSSITLENNLANQFSSFKGLFSRLGFIKRYWASKSEEKRKRAENYYKTLFGDKNIDLKKVKQKLLYLAGQIRTVIEPVTIRRNRLDLLNNPFYKKEIKNLSQIDDPKEWFFELTKEQSEFYDKIISSYFGEPDDGGLFKGAIYRPFEYEKKPKQKLSEKENFQYQQQRNLYDFMRRLLVKRFESSFGSFKQSIENFKKLTENILAFIEKTDKYILDRGLLEKIYDLDSDKIEKHLEDYSEKIRNGDYPKNHKIYNVNKFKFKDKFIDDINADLKLFGNILNDLSNLNLVKNDPKTKCLIENVKNVLEHNPNTEEPKRKLIIFSEYLDTVKYIKPHLEKHFPGKLLTVDKNLSTSKIAQINGNFDASHKVQENEFEILLTTDKISEGFNLNRAGMVINYDIPWNPVRVIQRVGRINRISKKVFELLYIVNFFPTEQGAELVKSREIAANKMFMIHNTLGEDSKIFDVDEEPSPSGLYEKFRQNPEKAETESFYTKVLNIFLKIEKENPELIRNLKNYPSRIKVSKKSDQNELLVFYKKGRLYINSINYDENKVKQKSFDEVFNEIICKKSEPKLQLDNNFWRFYEKIKTFKQIRNIPISEMSLEQQALNNLKTLIAKPWDELLSLTDFLRTLREDILDYGTLADYTLRRLANLDFATEKNKKNTIFKIIAIREQLGEDYLTKEKERQNDLTKEIIIAVENRINNNSKHEQFSVF